MFYFETKNGSKDFQRYLRVSPIERTVLQTEGRLQVFLRQDILGNSPTERRGFSVFHKQTGYETCSIHRIPSSEGLRKCTSLLDFYGQKTFNGVVRYRGRFDLCSDKTDEF